MQAALMQTGIDAGAIVAIKAHATGSADNDLAEAAAMKTVFGARVPPFTGLKRSLGHTLAACGAVETVAFLACLDAGFIPPTAGFEALDPALGVQPLAQAQSAPAGIYLYNFFGFGGNYGSLVIGHG
jgi:3-oxoacyl-(acyl-carrier-protein) synthase